MRFREDYNLPKTVVDFETSVGKLDVLLVVFCSSFFVRHCSCVVPIVALLSSKKEPVEIDEDLEAESRELLKSSDTFEDESELCEQSLCVGHQMDETYNTASENTKTQT